MKKLIVVGAGGHSKSVCDSIDESCMELCGFIDQHKTGLHLGKPIYNDVESIPEYKSYSYFVAIGDVDARKSWYERLKGLGLEFVNIIDRTAIIAKHINIGVGNFVGKLAIINADVVIGDNNVINTRALLEHDCHIGNHTHVSTNTTINGNVVVEDLVFFGSTGVCNGQLRIGEHAVVGSGSVIIRDVAPYTTVVGVPGRVVKENNR